MSKISFEKLREHGDSLLEILILKCLSKKNKNGKILWERLDKKELDPQNMDIKFSIDGLEFPVIEIFQQFADQLDYIAKEAAKDLINDEFDELDDLLYELKTSIKSIAAKKLGITLEDDF